MFAFDFFLEKTDMWIKVFEIVEKKHISGYKLNTIKSIDKAIGFSRKEKNLNVYQIQII